MGGYIKDFRLFPMVKHLVSGFHDRLVPPTLIRNLSPQPPFWGMSSLSTLSHSFHLVSKCQFYHNRMKIPLCSLFFSGRLHKLTLAPGRGAGFLPASAHPTLASYLTPETAATWLNFYPYAKLPTQCGYLGVLWPSQNPNVQNGSPPLLSKAISPSPIFQSRGPASPLSWCLT